MRRYSRHSGMQPLLRAITVLSTVTILATGATFAALESRQAGLSGSSIQTATADLKISSTTAHFTNTLTGFTFEEVVPGTAAVPAGDVFYLKNYGSPALKLSVAVNSTPVNEAGVDLRKVYFVLTRTDTKASQKLSLHDLMASNQSGGSALTDNLAGGMHAQYRLYVTMDADSFSGPSADITGIDFVFNGTAVVQ